MVGNDSRGPNPEFSADHGPFVTHDESRLLIGQFRRYVAKNVPKNGQSTNGYEEPSVG